MTHRAVVFDLFGTLVDNFTHSRLAASLHEMAEALGVPSDAFREGWLETYVPRNKGAYASAADNIQHVCELIGRAVTEEAVARAAAIRLAFTRSYLAPRGDTIAALAVMKETGRGLALVSDCSIEVPTLWPETAFAPLFDVTVFSCAMKTKKPDPRMYLAASEGLGVAPGACVYVGDGSSRELSGAAAVGMYPVLIRAPHEENEEAYRPNEEPWEGPMVRAVSEVLGLLR